MIKFTTWRPGAIFEGCYFDKKGEFYANDKQAEILRNSKLFASGDIVEVGEAEKPPTPVIEKVKVKPAHKTGMKTTMN